MITASLSEAKNRLVSLVKTVEEGGETVVLCRNGVGVAEIRPLPAKKRLLRNLVPSLLGRQLCARLRSHRSPDRKRVAGRRPMNCLLDTCAMFALASGALPRGQRLF